MKINVIVAVDDKLGIGKNNKLPWDIPEDLAHFKNITTNFYQSNIEGEIVNQIQEISENMDGLIINAAAFTHTSVAILDALNTLKIPKIEIHISNVFAREEFRHKSMISKSVNGVICGFGLNSYILGVDAVESIIKNENK